MSLELMYEKVESGCNQGKEKNTPTSQEIRDISSPLYNLRYAV